MPLKMIEPCPHDLGEIDAAIQADGYCPLCLLKEVLELRKIVAGWRTVVSASAGSGFLKANEEREERYRKALKDIQARSVGVNPPRHSWYYDRAEEALSQHSNGDRA